ncbi:flagellar basal body rod protein FlgC [Methylobacter tundripaludum]|jgi:flagellar basal-body rod protein FlgC|uniref:Flagellar basal-body rod protein FlgC n=2 Tax=Methylobacter tundripaludum TaxID=173365 RepID=G3ISV7_METTV|nr:flagellar basal body rod protein FlgC [Methylobacter tundripaludum]EGW22431.1 flagellar basal-body rod protein FlgC [Methylobacter tundripaludum SV96]MDD4905110.1 flagellar basal body rod protein FlgC [Methylobacter tundripaludum]PPK77114.1 flagellar basal-body rod protein FlgC [Methylobacter tundripaludum]
MASSSIFDIAGSGMNAQSLRLNLVASNISNANSVSSSAADVYKSRQPVFAAELDKVINKQNATSKVNVLGVVEGQDAPVMEYAPNHPMANSDGYIFKSNVNTVEEMANMMSASRSYQNNVDVLNTAKQMMLQTLKMGQ